MTQDSQRRLVGADLQESEEAEAIVAAISAKHPEAVVRRSPGLVRVEVPKRLEVRRDLVERFLNRNWDTQDFNLSIVSFFGEIEDWDEDHIVIGWSH